MPRGERTGPMGFGPVTGRGAGYCGGAGVPGSLSAARGRGGGRGWRHWAHATGLPGWARAGMGVPGWGAAPFPPMAPVAPTTSGEAEVDALRAQAGHLEQALHLLRKKIQKLEGETKTE
jgi:hypothetical protein